jgi:hypothetical protein
MVSTDQMSDQERSVLASCCHATKLMVAHALANQRAEQQQHLH